VIANVNNSLKQCNGSVIIPNGPVNSEVNLSMYRDDGRVTAETYVGSIEQKYENKNKKVHSLVKKLKINVKMHGEHNVNLNRNYVLPTESMTKSRFLPTGI
jgi:hypothetical protein